MLYINPIQDSRLDAAGAAAGQQREKVALEEFERLFVFQLLREMRKSVPESPLFGQNQQEKFFTEMLDDHLAGEMARSGQLGLADQIKMQLEARRGGAASGEAGSEGGFSLATDAAPMSLPRKGGIKLDDGLYSRTPAPLPITSTEPDLRLIRE